MKHFTIETKIKWAEAYLKTNKKNLIVKSFLNTYQYRYNNGYKQALRCAWTNLYLWSRIYEKYGSWALQRMNKHKRRKPDSITKLNKNDLQIYQEIMEAVLAKKGVTPEDIAEEFRKRKEEIANKKQSAGCISINRCAAYYKPRPRNTRVKINPWLLQKIQAIIAFSDWTIGRDKIVAMIQNIYHSTRLKLNTYLIRKHIEYLHYKSRIHTKKHYRPREKKLKAELFADLIQRKFKNTTYNEVWYTDVSYIPINKRFYYLSIMIDGFNNEIVGWSISKTNDTKLVIDSFKKALIYRNNQPPKIIHSDHGVQYGSNIYIGLMNDLGIKISMSPKGDSLANRPAEFFFCNIKREKIRIHKPKNYSELIVLVTEYIDWYNFRRVQKNLNYQTPFFYKEQFLNNKKIKSVGIN